MAQIDGTITFSDDMIKEEREIIADHFYYSSRIKTQPSLEDFRKTDIKEVKIKGEYNIKSIDNVLCRIVSLRPIVEDIHVTCVENTDEDIKTSSHVGVKSDTHKSITDKTITYSLNKETSRLARTIRTVQHIETETTELQYF